MSEKCFVSRKRVMGAPLGHLVTQEIQDAVGGFFYGALDVFYCASAGGGDEAGSEVIDGVGGGAGEAHGRPAVAASRAGEDFLLRAGDPLERLRGEADLEGAVDLAIANCIIALEPDEAFRFHDEVMDGELAGGGGEVGGGAGELQLTESLRVGEGADLIEDGEGGDVAIQQRERAGDGQGLGGIAGAELGLDIGLAGDATGEALPPVRSEERLDVDVIELGLEGEGVAGFHRAGGGDAARAIAEGAGIDEERGALPTEACGLEIERGETGLAEFASLGVDEPCVAAVRGEGERGASEAAGGGGGPVPVCLADDGLAEIDGPAFGAAEGLDAGCAGEAIGVLGSGWRGREERGIDIDALDGELIDLDGVTEDAVPIERGAELVRIDGGETASIGALRVEVLAVDERAIELQRGEVRAVGVEGICGGLTELVAECLAVEVAIEEGAGGDDCHQEEDDEREERPAKTGEKPIHQGCQPNGWPGVGQAPCGRERLRF